MKYQDELSEVTKYLDILPEMGLAAGTGTLATLPAIVAALRGGGGLKDRMDRFSDTQNKYSYEPKGEGYQEMGQAIADNTPSMVTDAMQGYGQWSADNPLMSAGVDTLASMVGGGLKKALPSQNWRQLPPDSPSRAEGRHTLESGNEIWWPKDSELDAHGRPGTFTVYDPTASGTISAEKGRNGYRVAESGLAEEFQGQGRGAQMYDDLADWVANENLPLGSDSSLRPDTSYPMYDRFARNGRNVGRSNNTELVDGKYVVSDKPVFSVMPNAGSNHPPGYERYSPLSNGERINYADALRRTLANDN